MNNLNILAALAGALCRCRSLAGNGHAARPAPCIASRQHTHNCPGYSWTAPKGKEALMPGFDPASMDVGLKVNCACTRKATLG